MIIYTAISYLQLRNKVKTATPLYDNIRQSEAVVSPFILGFIKPKIYLPYSIDEKSMYYIIAHEQAHLKRRDHLIKPTAFLILSVYWFNPLIWIAYVLLCRDIELACDEKVIRDMEKEERQSYSRSLIQNSVNRPLISACPLAFGEVGVKERVKSVMSYKKPTFWIISVAVIACVVTTVCFLTNPKDYSNVPDINLNFNVSNLTDEEFGRVGTHDIENATKDDFKTIELLLEVNHSNKISNRTIKMPNIIKILKDEDIYWFGDYSSQDNKLENFAKYEGKCVFLSRGLDEQAIKNLFSSSEVKVSWTTDKGEEKERVFNLGEIIQFKFGGIDRAKNDYQPENKETYIGGVNNPETVYETACAYANYSEEGNGLLSILALNTDKMMINNLQHLPILKFESKAELDNFKSEFSKYFTMRQGYDEMPSFEDISKNYGETFFEDNALFLVYITSSSSSYRYRVDSIYNADGTFAVGIQRTTPEIDDTTMVGCFITVAVDKKRVSNCSSFDATLDVPINSEAKCYLYTDSEDGLNSYIHLLNETYFEFNLSIFSSYIPHGTYKINDEYLVLKTNDGSNKKYTFKVKGDSFIFDASKSSGIPKFSPRAYAEPKPAVPDGAIFELNNSPSHYNMEYNKKTPITLKVNEAQVIDIIDNRIIVDSENIQCNDSKFYSYDSFAFPVDDIEKWTIGDKVKILHPGEFAEGNPPVGTALLVSAIE